MNGKTIITCMALLLSVVATATPISQQQARQRAAAFMAAKGISIEESALVKAPRKIQGSQTADASYYVFNATLGQGYVIVSGDNCTESILGYSDKGTFDVNNVPEGLQWLLNMYDEQIRRLNDLGITTNRAKAKAQQVHRPIAPLLKTLWNQGDPYNLLCPRYYREDGSQGDLSATGCVATAIAQVMSFYRYPAETKRMIPGYSQVYSTVDGDKRVQLRNISAGSVIDWDNILNEYHGGETDEQKQAIAQLMYWVGMGCKMSYGGSSAAGFPEGVKALINYFGYDDGTHIESRGNFTAAAWENLLYNELLSGHPVAFAGTNTGGAHAFVLDGYDIDGLFHVNWGWGGMDNGYFRIDVLAPDDNSGIGASITPDAYNMGQDAIIGMRLPDDIPAPATVYQLTVNDWEIRNGNTFFANYVNWSGVNADWNMGIGYINEEGGVTLIGSYRSQYLGTDTYIGYEFRVTGLKPGIYRIVPVSKRANDREWQVKVNPDITYILAVVDDEGSVKLEKHPIESITMTEMRFPGNHKKGDRQAVTAVFTNQGDEYLREIHLFASRTTNKGYAICRTNVGILEGGESTASFSFTPDVAGTWNVWLATDSRGNDIVGHGSVEITNEGIASSHHLRYVSNSLGNRSNGIVYGDKMQGKVTILNQDSKAFDGKVRLWLHRSGNNGYYYGVSSIYVPMHIEPNRTANANFYFDRLELGTTYALSILYEEGGDIQDGGLRQMGHTQAGIVYWQQNMSLGGMAVTGTVYTPSSAVAMDMRCAPVEKTSIIPNGNPNTLYIFPEETTCPEELEKSNVVIGNHARQIVLSDDYGFVSPLSFTANSVTYNRTSTADKWETIALPFAVDNLPTDVELQEFSQVDDAGDVVFQPTTDMDGNVPYMIRSNSVGELTFSATNATVSSTIDAPMAVGTPQYRFCGTTIRQNLSDIFVLNDEGSAFVPVKGQKQVNPFRAYFTAPLNISSILTPQSATAISRVEKTVNEDQPIYDLQGRRVLNPGRGLYIVNHKKVVILP